MSLQSLVDSFGIVKDYSEEEKNELKRLKDLLREGKYKLLRQILDEKQILTTGNLKSLSLEQYNSLKSYISSLSGVGEEKTDLFFNKLDEIRKTKYDNNTTDSIVNYGIIGQKNEWHIQINKLYHMNTEYIDIRKIGPDGSRSRGISIDIKDFELFKKIINSIDTNNSIDILSSNTDVNDEVKTTNKHNNKLKEIILKNEEELLNLFGEKYQSSIRQFICKINALRYDGDIVKFLSNDSVSNSRKEYFDLVHKYGKKTAVDLMRQYENHNLLYTSIDDLEIGDKLTTMTICAIANNYNATLGMYYKIEDDIVILKGDTCQGRYKNKWINEYELLYYLQTEKEKKYKTLEFSHRPNQICRDIILKLNSTTKVYLFARNNKKEEYTYYGQVKPIRFSNNNKCILVSRNYM